MFIDGVLIINASGELSNSSGTDVVVDGFVFNYGSFSSSAEFHVDGTVNNSGYILFSIIHNDGYICNTGVMETTGYFYVHGGMIDCGGTIITCELNMDDNTSSVEITGSVSGELLAQNICCSDPLAINPLNLLEGSWYIDSSSVSICELPFEVSAGDNNTSSICNSTGSQIDLNSLLSGDVDMGTFMETTASGAFDSATGVFNTDGLTAGTYTFTFTVIGYNSVTDVSEFEITVNPVLMSSSDLSACSSDLPIEWNGLSLSTEGTHSVTFTSEVTGCDSIVSLELAVDYFAAPELLSSGPVECPLDIVELSVVDISNAQFHWIGPMGYESEDVTNEFELGFDNSGTYSAYYTINSCVSEVAEIELNVESAFEFKQFDFPNVITANNDNVNDEIEIEKYVGKCQEFTLTVRDRWGNQVYVQERGEPSFNGNSILGEKLPEGVYFYKLAHGKGASTGFIHLVK